VKSGRASKTAEHNALFRALDARGPNDARVVSDRLAEGFLSWRFRLVTVPATWRVWHGAVTRIIDRRWPGVRPTVLARTQLIDGMIRELVGTTPQVVILGAGLDTRSWRLPELSHVAVFEVDHPDTQRRKRLLLRRHNLCAAHVHFIPTDFNLGRLDTAMTEAGFDPTIPTLFLWEGTTNYLSAQAVDATLRWCARAVEGSQLIFTYINEDVLDDPSRYVGAERVFVSLRRADEPMTFGLAPDALTDYLAERGLQLITDTGAEVFRRQCYGAASAAIHGHEFYRVAHARVTAPVASSTAHDTAGHPSSPDHRASLRAHSV
jgi:methyltransferase (TIGR00027 family)